VLILDVGCGTGNPPVRASVQAEDFVIGIDLSLVSLRIAKERYPQRQFLCGRAESLPFSDCSFERVVSAVAMPYTNIPLALAEIHRVLVPGGSLFMSLHPLRFTLDELRHALRYPKAILYRLYVLANGVFFHASGRVFGIGGNVESFQTTRGLRLALKRAGFVAVEVSRPDGRLLVEAKTIGVEVPLLPLSS
jgi:ubiquinone/menaquinone biosynthesis C-methylase UbiE